MKIRILGFTVFEIEPNSSANSSGKPPALPAAPSAPRRGKAAALSPPRPLADLLKADGCLPRTRHGTLDVDAALHLFGIKDVAILWQRKYPLGSGGASIKRILGSLGRKPILLGKVHPPRAKRLASGANISTSALGQPPMAPQPDALQGEGVNHVSPEQKDCRGPLATDPHGSVDVAASLQILGISDPKTLWRDKVRPGSLEHKLKKEIARRLARGETVAGMTRRDIGLPE